MSAQPCLNDLQRWLRWMITDPRGVDDALAAVGTGASAAPELRFRPLELDRVLRRYEPPQPSCLSFIEESSGFRRTERLNIYAEAYFSRISSVLAENFAAVHEIVGVEAFFPLAHDYLKEFPSRFESVSEVGYAFSEFLARHALADQLPFLPDLAQLEWLTVESYFAEDELLLSGADLARIEASQWPKALFSLGSSVGLLKSSWDVDALRRSRGFSQGSLELLPPGGGPDKRNDAFFFLVWRENFDVQVRALPELEFFALERVRDGDSLELICEKLEERISRGSELALSSIQEWLQSWIAAGVIRKVKIP